MNDENTQTTAPSNTVEINLNQLDGIRGFGLFLMSVVVLFIIYCMVWVYRHYNSRIVKAHQPIFLFTILIGLFLWTLSVIPASIDDAVASVDGCTIACNARLWMAEFGFTISFAALFSKLMRVNKLFHNPQFRRITVKVKDVLMPFLVLASINFGLLLTLSLVDPLQWVREPINNDPTDTYGYCKEMGTVASICVALVSIVNFVALLLCVYQAYHARNISEEFSESKYLALGLYNWLQLAIISIPLFILIDDDADPSLSYFLDVAFSLAQVMSMLLALFLPIFMRQRQMARNENINNGGNVRITGLSTRATAGTTQVSHGSPPESAESNGRVSTISTTTDSTRSKVETLEKTISDLEKANRDLKQTNERLTEQLQAS